MKLSDFDFDLPEQLIATRPARPRSASRLLVATPDQIIDRHVTDIVDYLKPGDRLVLNDTKVLAARLTGARTRMSEQGPVSARIQVTLLEPTGPGNWRVLLKPLRKVRVGETIQFADNFSAEMIEKSDGAAVLKFSLTGDDFDRALRRTGQMPLPPYIEAKRPADNLDFQDYQTVWARHSGAVAAPTASLHYDQLLLDRLTAAGVDISHVTLHVGAGTFLPVKVDDIKDHKMHAERGYVSETAAQEINQTIAAGNRVIPVGTTALRLLETAATAPGQLEPWQGATDIFISPGYEFKIADALVTNFHLPRSTLMMLVSAVMGHERVRQIYAHAIQQRYRFFSYGDASLLIPAARSRPR